MQPLLRLIQISEVLWKSLTQDSNSRYFDRAINFPNRTVSKLIAT